MTEAKGYRDGWFGTLDPEAKSDPVYKEAYRRGDIAERASRENISFRKLWRLCNEPMISPRRKKEEKPKQKVKNRNDWLDELELYATEGHDIVKKRIYPAKIEQPLLNDFAALMADIEAAREEIDSVTKSYGGNPTKKTTTVWKDGKKVTTTDEGKKVIPINGGKKSGTNETGSSGNRPAGTPSVPKAALNPGGASPSGK